MHDFKSIPRAQYKWVTRIVKNSELIKGKGGKIRGDEKETLWEELSSWTIRMSIRMREKSDWERKYEGT